MKLRARWTGILLQGLILGLLLTVAVVNLLLLNTETRLFRYESF